MKKLKKTKEIVDINYRPTPTSDEPVQRMIQEETELKGKWEDVVVDCPKCGSSDNVYLYVDKRTCYCLECAEEFNLLDALDGLQQEYVFSESDVEPNTVFDDSLEDRELQAKLAGDLVSDDPAKVNEAMKLLEIAKPDAKKGLSPLEQGKLAAQNMSKNYPLKSSNKDDIGFTHGYGYSGGYTGNQCFHRPQHIIAGEGWGVWAGKKEDVRGSLHDFDIVMNLTYTSVKDAHVIPIPELAKWSSHGANFVEIQMDWADYGTINLPIGFWQDLVNYIRDNKKKLLIFCQGGHGRTGTALASLFVVALGYKPIDAIAWVRKNYCYEAIETKGQENYVLSLMPEEKEIIPEPKSSLITEPEKALEAGK